MRGSVFAKPFFACGFFAMMAFATVAYGDEPNPVYPSRPPAAASDSAPVSNSDVGAAPGSPADFSSLVQAIERQQAEIEQLKASLAARRQEEETARAEDRAKQDEALKSAMAAADAKLAAAPLVRGAAGLTLSGYVQADLQFRQSSQNEVDGSTGAPLNQDRFLIRRARLRLAGDWGIIGGALEFDGNTVNGATARILAAEANVRWPSSTDVPYVMATIGLFKTPFGYEVGIERDTQRLFMERSTAARALFPGEYDLGARLSGGWRFLRYSLAVMNGNPAGDKQFTLRDPSKSKDFVGRLGVDLHVGTRVALQAGFSGVYGTGFHQGTPATKDVLVWRDFNENGTVDPGELQVITGAAATPSTDFKRWALGGDARLRVDLPVLGALVVFGEVAYAGNLDRGVQPADPVAAARALRELGWHAGFTLDLTRYAQIGARYDYYNPDFDARDRLAGTLIPANASYATAAFAAALRYADRARLVVEYDLNRNHLGRDANGAPTNLKDNAVLVRGEVVF